MKREDEIHILAAILRPPGSTAPADAPFSAERYASEILATRDAERRGIEHITLTPLSWTLEERAPLPPLHSLCLTRHPIFDGCPARPPR